MTPDRLRAWLSRNVVGAHSLQLRAEEVGGDGIVFQVWRCDALPEDLVQAIFDASGDYADSAGEAVRVRIEFLNDEGDILSVQIHKAKTPEAQTYDAANADQVSRNGLIGQLLRHIEVQQRVLSGGSMNTLNALERALNIQSRMMEKQGQQIAQLADQIVQMRREKIQAVADSEDEDGLLALTPETEEESRARARAMDKFSELLPLVIAGVSQYMTQRAGMNGAAPAAE